MRKVRGWKRDHKDPRDLRFKIIAPSSRKASSDLRSIAPLVRNQGDEGDCTGYGTTSIVMGLEKKDGKDQIILSSQFSYYHGLLLSGGPITDDGCEIRNVIKGAVQYGVCSELLWPTRKETFGKEPNKDCYAFATNHQVTYYFRLHGLDDIRGCLSDGFPVVFGASLYSNFDKVGSDGMLGMPKGEYEGGHCMSFWGHNDSTKILTVMNSWGDDWGDKGYLYIPYDYVEKLDQDGVPLVTDCWTIRTAENM